MTLFDATLPTDWTWETVQARYRITKKSRALNIQEAGQIPFVPMDAVPLGGQRGLSYQMRKPSEITSGTYFERGDVLLSKITPSFENGKQAMAWDIPKPFGYGSTEIIPIQAATGKANNSFLFFYFLHPEIRTYLAGKMEGSTGRQRIPEHAVRELPVPQPPKPEQEKIAAVLWKVQKAVEVQEKLIRTTRELKAAAMRRLFTHGLRNEPLKETEIGPVPKSWDIVPLGSFGRVGNGSTPKRTNPAYWQGGTLPWLTSAKVYEGLIERADEFVTEIARRECHLPKVRAGSLVIAITGQGRTLGHCALVAFETCVSQHIAYVQFERGDVAPAYVHQFICSRYEHLRQISQGGGSTKGALTCGFLKGYPIPLPAVDEQRQIAHILQTLDRKLALHEKKRAALQDLFKTLLHQLMTARIRVHELEIDTSEVAA